jgi:formate/nitrite transporter FocA (FNT family)
VNTEVIAKNPMPGEAARFFWTALVAFPINLVVLIMLRAELGSAAMWAVVIAWIAGIVALCIPARHKAAFIIPGVLGGLAISFGFLWLLARWWEH